MQSFLERKIQGTHGALVVTKELLRRVTSLIAYTTYEQLGVHFSSEYRSIKPDAHASQDAAAYPYKD